MCVLRILYVTLRNVALRYVALRYVTLGYVALRFFYVFLQNVYIKECGCTYLKSQSISIIESFLLKTIKTKVLYKK